MLNIMKMNAVGSEGKTPIMNFEFTFDNSTELPKGPGYQLGQRIYVIEEGSTAINNSTNIIYKYSFSKWIKTPDKATSTTNTITENGSYNIASNIATGVGNIDVNVIGGGVTLIEKTITENGTYLPAEDEATAYSKVTVNVQPSSLFYIGRTEGEWDALPYRYGRGFLTMNPDDDGVVSCGDSDVTKLNIQYIIVENPVKTIKSGTSSGVYFYFTPTDDFTGFYREGTDVAITTVGDTVTPGDGKCYSYEVKGMGSPAVTKYDYDFSFELSPSST